MKPLRVLSIDWDYLVNATMVERLETFPDGGNENLHESVSKMIWSARYAHPQLSKIGVDVDALDILKDFISKNCNNALIVVEDSHKGIYDAVVNHPLYKPHKPLEVINVDFHHDMYENNLDSVDCGNWVNFLFETKGRQHKRKLRNKSSHYYWIAREDSDTLTISEECQRLSYMTKKDINFLKTLEDFKYDLLFICRSGIWSPPHLDEEFMNFYDWCIDNTDTWELPEVNRNVWNTRWGDMMKKAVDSQVVALQELQNKLFNKKEV